MALFVSSNTNTSVMLLMSKACQYVCTLTTRLFAFPLSADSLGVDMSAEDTSPLANLV